mgnify:CR=1 FL=1|jgi:hypothetical protein
MATVASSTPALNISYTLNEIHNGGASSEYSDVGYTALNYPDGTGTGQITIGVVASGYISSGETIHYDFQKFPKRIWDNQILLDFTSSYDSLTLDNPERGVKGMVVANTWAGSSGEGIEDWFPISGLPRINIHATGNPSLLSGGFSGLFNDGSGNVAINPQGRWAFTDVLGKTPIFDTGSTRYDHVLSLTTENFTNVSGSGGTGVGGVPVYYPIWNDVTSGSPWSGNLPRLPYEILVIGVTG